MAQRGLLVRLGRPAPRDPADHLAPTAQPDLRDQMALLALPELLPPLLDPPAQLVPKESKVRLGQLGLLALLDPRDLRGLKDLLVLPDLLARMALRVQLALLGLRDPLAHKVFKAPRDPPAPPAQLERLEPSGQLAPPVPPVLLALPDRPAPRDPPDLRGQRALPAQPDLLVLPAQLAPPVLLALPAQLALMGRLVLLALPVQLAQLVPHRLLRGLPAPPDPLALPDLLALSTPPADRQIVFFTKTSKP